MLPMKIFVIPEKSLIFVMFSENSTYFTNEFDFSMKFKFRLARCNSNHSEFLHAVMFYDS